MISQVFSSVQQADKPLIRVSFTEIYNEVIYDLLDPQKKYLPVEQWAPVQLMEGEDGIVLRNLNVYEVKSEEEALTLFFMGSNNRYVLSFYEIFIVQIKHFVLLTIIPVLNLKLDKLQLLCF